jgi:hypothetical protein
MREITPPRSERLKRSKGKGSKAATWPQVIEWYRRAIAVHHWQFEPMLHLAERIAASPAASELFPTLSMGRLLITDGPTFYHDDNVLFITYDQSSRQFEFEHRTLARHDDHKTCAESEAFQTLDLFLRYKYGVLLQTPTA